MKVVPRFDRFGVLGKFVAILTTILTHGRALAAEQSAAPGVDSVIPEWAHSRFVGLELWQLLGVGLLVLVAIVLQKLVVFGLGSYVHKIATRLRVRWVVQIVRHADRPVGGLAMAAVFFLGFPALEFGERATQIAVFATRVLATFSVVWLGYRLVDVLAEFLAEKAEKTDTRLDDQLVPLLRKSLKVIFVAVGGLFILQNLDVDVGSLLAGLGLGGLAFALAAKDTVANFIGSIVIFLDKPFQIGDWVKIDSQEGTVEEVGFRSTRLRTFYNSLVTVPNAKFMSTEVDNMGARQYRRYSTMLGLTYDTPAEKVQAFCEGVRAIIMAVPMMRKDFYLVEFRGFGAHSLDIMLYCFMEVPDWATEVRVRTNLNLEILRFAAAIGVSFAFPTQTLHVETFPHAGKSKVPAPSEPEIPRLAEVVTAFGPGGGLARPTGFSITSGYDAFGRAGAKGIAAEE